MSAYVRGSAKGTPTTVGALWQFNPCGCEAREILEEQL